MQKNIEDLTLKNKSLQARITELEDTLSAIRKGEVDALVIDTDEGERVYSLTSAETTYRILIEQMNEGAAILSLDGIVLYCNKRFSEMTNTPLETIISNNLDQLLDSDQKKRFATLLENGSIKNVRENFTFPANGGNGQNDMHFMFSLSPFVHDAGQEFLISLPDSKMVSLIVTDITALKKIEKKLEGYKANLEIDVRARTKELELTNKELESSRLTTLSMMEDVLETSSRLQESERKISTLLSNLPGMAYRCENVTDWTMLFISNGCINMTGYPPEEIINNRETSYNNIIHPEDRVFVWEKIQQALKNDKQFELEYRIIRKDKKERWVWERGICVSTSKNGPAILEGFISDITQRKHTEEMLRESENNLVNAQKLAHVGSWRLNIQTGAIDWSEEVFRIFGADRTSMQPDSHFVFSRFHPDDLYLYDEVIKQAAEHDEQFTFENRIILPGGITRYLISTSEGQRDKTGKLTHITGTVQDITIRKEAQARIEHLNRVLRAIRNVNQLITKERSQAKLLKNSCKRLTETGGYSSAWIALLDDDGKFFKFAQSGLGAYGDTMARQLDQPESVYCAQKALLNSGVQSIEDTKNQCQNCCLTDVHDAKDALAVKLEYETKLYGVLSVSLPPTAALDDEEHQLFEEVAGDICFALHTIEMEKKRTGAEAALEASLQEKIQLIGELYHRTKNNMQVIISMLMIQAGITDNEKVKEILRDTVSRIQAMSLVHEKLYQSQTLSRINLDEYINDLTQLLVKTYHVESNKIKLSFELEQIPVLIDTAVPCGLVLNELIANALKHAFPEKRDGEIKIVLQRTQNQDINLVLTDNGIGVPDGFNFRNNESFGLQTAILIVEHQLQGKIDFAADHGVSCHLRFRDDLYQERV